jgi:hypothetical protein
MKVPAIDGYTPPFGTKITRTDINRGGLSTREVTENVLMPFSLMRPKTVTEDSTTTAVEYDAKIVFTAASGTTPSAGHILTMGNGSYVGCTVTFTNLLSYACTVMQADGITTLFEVPAGGNVFTTWNGSVWNWAFNQCHPIGEIYVQFPGQKSPAELFGSYGVVWTDITADYAGLFFRAAGTVSGTDNASGSFSTNGITVQSEGLPDITGDFGYLKALDSGNWVQGLNNSNGAFKKSYNERADPPSYSAVTSQNNTDASGVVVFNASNSNSIYGSSDHVTPVNTAIKIWKRTA